MAASGAAIQSLRRATNAQLALQMQASRVTNARQSVWLGGAGGGTSLLERMSKNKALRSEIKRVPKLSDTKLGRSNIGGNLLKKRR